MKGALVLLAFGLLPILSAQTTNKAVNVVPSDEWGTKTFDVKYVDPEQLRAMFSERSFVMEANQDLKLLTAHGSAAFLKEVEETVKRVDVAPPLPADIQITVYLATVAAQAPSAGVLPRELLAIGKELTAAGSQALRLADSQMLRVRAGQPGEAAGSADSQDAAKLSRIRLQSASISPGPKGDTISINGLRVWLNIPSVTELNRSKMDADVSADIDVAQNQAAIVSKTGINQPVVVIVRADVVH